MESWAYGLVACLDFSHVSASMWNNEEMLLMIQSCTRWCLQTVYWTHTPLPMKYVPFSNISLCLTSSRPVGLSVCWRWPLLKAVPSDTLLGAVIDAPSLLIIVECLHYCWPALNSLTCANGGALPLTYTHCLQNMRDCTVRWMKHAAIISLISQYSQNKSQCLCHV